MISYPRTVSGGRLRHFALCWLGAGLAAQIGLAFWPVDNYSTLVYLLLYFPAMLLLYSEREIARDMLVHSDRWLIMAFLGVLIWSPISVIWSDVPQDIKTENLIDYTQISLLILLYTLGVGLLVRLAPRLFRLALLSSLALAAVLGALSLVRFIAHLPEPGIFPSFIGYVRLSTFGYGPYIAEVNPVPAAVYYGALTLVGAALVVELWTKPRQQMFLFYLVVLCTAVCLTVTVLTWTRTALAGLAGAAAIALLCCGKKKLLVGLAVASAISGAAIAMFNFEQLVGYATRGGLGSLRPQIWAASAQASLDHLWFGAGMGADTTLQISAAERPTAISQPHSHNFYLQILYWCGLIGMAFYLTLLLRGWRLSVIQGRQLSGRLGLLILSYFTVVQLFDVYSVFTKPAYYWPCIWLPLGALIGGRTGAQPNALPLERAHSQSPGELEKNTKSRA